jgi:hypothetical protein
VKTIGLDQDEAALQAARERFRGLTFFLGRTCLTFDVGHYDNGRLALVLIVADDEAARMLSGVRPPTKSSRDAIVGETYDVLTVNLVDEPVDDGCIHVRSHRSPLSQEILEALRESVGCFDVVRDVSIGPYGSLAHVWRCR